MSFRRPQTEEGGRKRLNISKQGSLEQSLICRSDLCGCLTLSAHISPYSHHDAIPPAGTATADL